MERNISLSIVQCRLPVPGLVAQNTDDDYTILLSTDLSDTEKAATFLHECLHIWHRVFDSGMGVDQIETVRHAELKEIAEILMKQKS